MERPRGNGASFNQDLQGSRDITLHNIRPQKGFYIMTDIKQQKVNIEKFKGKMEKEESGCTIVVNKTIQNIRDVTSLGVYAYLSTKPPSWEINVKEICRHFSLGRDKVRRTLSNLVSIGALSVIVSKLNGKFAGTDYILHLNLAGIEFSPGPENQAPAPGPEKPAPVNQGLYKTKNINNKESAGEINARAPASSSKERPRASACPPPRDALHTFKAHNVGVPTKFGVKTKLLLDNAIDLLSSHNQTLGSYLDYLDNHCGKWLHTPYKIGGKERENDFYVILRLDIVAKAIEGEYEDKECQ